VAGDPLQDLESLRQVRMVIQNGELAWDGNNLTWDGFSPDSAPIT
jgi:hypothetical protein